MLAASLRKATGVTATSTWRASLRSPMSASTMKAAPAPLTSTVSPTALRVIHLFIRGSP
jgi:hypothetical protein